jgi:release factor glutamine methyltransferase
MEVYEPAEDSYLLSETITKEIKKITKTRRSNIKFLEIGPGSGVQLETALKNGIKKENILGADINTKAISRCKSQGFNCIKSNLFQKIPKTKFDVIVFNPPYLPEHKHDKQPDTSGGKKGNETINKFLKQAKSYLSKDGFILLLTSSFTPKINDLGYKKELLATKKIFFEELYVWKLRIK